MPTCSAPARPCSRAFRPPQRRTGRQCGRAAHCPGARHPARHLYFRRGLPACQRPPAGRHGFRHAPHEEQRGDHDADIDRDHEIDEDRQAERDQEHQSVGPGSAPQESGEMPDVARCSTQCGRGSPRSAAKRTCAAHGARSTMTRTRKIECTIPAIGLVAPFRIFVAVRATAPVAANPPNNGERMLAAPCPINSWFGLCRVPVMPSATTAVKSDPIAPSSAIVNAGPTSWITSVSDRPGNGRSEVPAGCRRKRCRWWQPRGIAKRLGRRCQQHRDEGRRHA